MEQRAEEQEQEQVQVQENPNHGKHNLECSHTIILKLSCP